MMCLKLSRSLFAIFALLAGQAAPAFGHSAEQGFILLLPTDVYITAGALAVAASILLVSFLGRKIPQWLSNPVKMTSPNPRPIPITSIASTAFLFAAIWIGLSGPRDPLGNILPLTIWILWWIGFVTCLPIFGNLWAHINPWTGVFSILSGSQKAPLRLPHSIGVWPGVLIFLGFHIFAIADISPSDPYRLALVTAWYWTSTLVGMLLFGGRSWLTRAECFTIFFTLIASLAPLQKSKLGMPGWATIRLENIGLSHAAFCIVMLGAGSFDGLHETFWWLAKIGINPLEFPGRSAVVWTSTLGMIGTCIVLGAVFSASIWIGNSLANNPNVSLINALAPFALSLVPIAFGYHVAHYLTSFLVGLQYSAIAISDPFATGADLIGFAKLQVTTGFLSDPDSVRIIWLIQAGVVVISHILAVMMAHTSASQLYKTQREILLSQSALSLLMIAYTVFGLWLLASPRGV
jgi:hypothetical protein